MRKIRAFVLAVTAMMLLFPASGLCDSNPMKKIGGRKAIVVIGDSQTEKKGYVEELQNRINRRAYTVVKFAQGGNGIVGMAMVQGGIGFYAEPFIIPAGTEAVEIIPYNDLNSEGMEALGVLSLSGLNTCEIAGIKGTLTTEYDEERGRLCWYFRRAKKGKETKADYPAEIKTDAMNYRGSILVVWLGTNDSYQQTDAEALANHLITVLDCMIDYNGTNSYIVIGLTSKCYCEVVDEVNVRLAKKYGRHFLDIRNYLLKYGLEDASITPLPEDILDIDNGEIPSSLRTDGVHFNDAGFRVIGDVLYRKGVELGYWK